MTDETAQVRFTGGRLYFTAAAHEEYFSGSNTVILLRNEMDLLVLPVRNAGSGGYVLKIRNSAGDRVVSGADFFRDQGLADDANWCGDYRWSEAAGGLQLYGMFLM